MGTILFDPNIRDWPFLSLSKRGMHNGGDLLITNEYPYYNPTFTASRDEDWFVTSGSIFSSFKGGKNHRVYYSGIPDDVDPKEHSHLHTNSQVFRMFSHKDTEMDNIKVTLDLKVVRYLGSTLIPEQTFDGFKVFTRCNPSDPNDKHYITPLTRRDGKIIGQKKVTQGSTFQIGSTSFNANTRLTLNQWTHFELIVSTEGSDCRFIVTKDGTQVLNVLDTNTGSVAAYTNSGNVGIRADNMEFFFDNFKVYSYP